MMRVICSDGSIRDFSDCGFRVDQGVLNVREAPEGTKAGEVFDEADTKFVAMFAPHYWCACEIIDRGKK
jgi:hypothetical protein